MSRSRKGAGSAERRRSITDAVPSPHLAELSLDELRAYRRRLTEEEDRVSYWRRLAHARIDVLEAEADTHGTLRMEQLVRVLGDTGAGNTRTALVSISAAEPLPELPVLEEMWVTEIDPDDEEQVADALRRIREAEKQLTDYRRALHERIDEATGELISRYRAQPSLALDLLRD
ncbi:hypothetical protein DDE18_16085 [Nocardioides gansuensis]|uniref:RsiG-like domain-containing protein n=1 Tax=Nocardioides gansuensis TaxID=2138300 RepID=A0A2T8F7W1_9ACTN|nr:hypothetical protein [Nocardioides gansuensis]PVG81790.1 hypothetical protein DDE18_16085 [Nocardioides gansuensis]